MIPGFRRRTRSPLFVTVIGHQWWWEYVYEQYDGQKLGFITANELHVPASDDGVPRPVYLTLKSADVCHSFWVPRLAGKTDLIPGRTNHLWFQTEPAGAVPGPVRRVLRHPARQHAAPRDRRSARRFRGAGWTNQQKTGRSTTRRAARAEALFLGQSCVNCHRRARHCRPGAPTPRT